MYNDKKSFYEDLPTKDGSVYIQHRNVQVLTIEFRKTKNGLSK